MHQQVGGLLIGNLGQTGTANGIHSSPTVQHAGAEDSVHWQQQLVKYTVSLGLARTRMNIVGRRRGRERQRSLLVLHFL